MSKFSSYKSSLEVVFEPKGPGGVVFQVVLHGAWTEETVFRTEVFSQLTDWGMAWRATPVASGTRTKQESNLRQDCFNV
jgi:hypothetical protein